MSLPTFDITIDEVVLHGVEPGQQYDLASALEEKLASLLARSAVEGHRLSSRRESSRRLPAVVLQSRGGQEIGEAVAISIANAISGEGRS